MRKYQIIYADPPWSYYNDSNSFFNKTTKVGIRKPPYPVMGSREIKALSVESIADKNNVLFIWTTDYHIKICMEVIEAWGFTYKTVGFVWQKFSKNGSPISFCGAYTLKSGIELCLLGVKGKGAHKSVERHNIKSLVQSQRRKHSQKPDEIRERIVELLGDRSRIELFAREKIKGWDVWGNEIKSDIVLERKY